MSLTNLLARTMPIPRPMLVNSSVKTQALRPISINNSKLSTPTNITMPKKAAFQKIAIIGKAIGGVIKHNATNFNSIIPMINSRLADTPEEKELWKEHAINNLHVGPMSIGQGKKIVKYKKFDAPKNLYPNIENQKKLLP